MEINNQLPKFQEAMHLQLLDDGWQPIKDTYSFRKTFLHSIPFMIVNALISIVIMLLFSNLAFKEVTISALVEVKSIIVIVSIVILHELLHLVFIPKFLTSKVTRIGFSLYGGFVFTEEELSKAKYIVIAVTPFIVISIISPIVLSFLNVLTSPIKFAIILNAIISSVDIYNLTLVLKKVSKNDCIIRCNGPIMYLKEKHKSVKALQQKQI